MKIGVDEEIGCQDCLSGGRRGVDVPAVRHQLKPDHPGPALNSCPGVFGSQQEGGVEGWSIEVPAMAMRVAEKVARGEHSPGRPRGM